MYAPPIMPAVFTASRSDPAFGYAVPLLCSHGPCRNACATHVPAVLKAPRSDSASRHLSRCCAAEGTATKIHALPVCL